MNGYRTILLLCLSALIIARPTAAQNAVVAIVKQPVVVRAKPVPYSLKIGALQPQAEVAVIAREGTWLQVLTQSGARGWVDNSLSDLVVKEDSWSVAPRQRPSVSDEKEKQSLEKRLEALEERVSALEQKP